MAGLFSGAGAVLLEAMVLLLCGRGRSRFNRPPHFWHMCNGRQLRSDHDEDARLPGSYTLPPDATPRERAFMEFCLVRVGSPGTCVSHCCERGMLSHACSA